MKTRKRRLVLRCLTLVVGGWVFLALVGTSLDIWHGHQTRPLMTAIRTQNLSQVKALLQRGGDPNTIEKPGDMASFWEHTMSILARMSGEPPYGYDKGDTSALVLAASLGDKAIIEALLAAGANINQQDYFRKDTPLIVASHEGHIEAVKTLLQHRANPNLPDFKGRTALGYAAWKGEGEIVRVLLMAGADTEIKDHDGYTPLLLAKTYGHLQAVQELEKEKTGIVRNLETIKKTRSDNIPISKKP